MQASCKHYASRVSIMQASCKPYASLISMTRNTHGIKGATHAGRCQGRCRDFEIRRCSGPGIPKSAAAAFRKTCNCEWDSQLRGLAKSRFAIAKSGNASARVPCALDSVGVSASADPARAGFRQPGSISKFRNWGRRDSAIRKRRLFGFRPAVLPPWCGPLRP